ncbi:MAG: patatin-like phospholipase family protein [Deltaproteobacteria bacterium]|nr:patatin-like phospholipase family protein [Deltaproteobacteria bacterium]
MTKRALVIEGGGFRGAYAAGVVYGLLTQAPEITFDVVVANSSSVSTGAYFVTKQAKELNGIWVDEKSVGSPKVLSWWRAPISFYKSFMNIDYVFDELMTKDYRLDLNALQKSKIDYFVTAMEFPTGRRHQFSNRDPQIWDAMRASCAVPWAYIGKIVIRGQRYIDGFYDSIPLRIAKEQGCDDIWIVSTRPKGYRKGRLKLFEILPLKHCRLLAKRHLYYNETAEEIEASDRYKVIRPEVKLPVSRLTNNAQEISEIFEMGQKDFKKFLLCRNKKLKS